MATGVVWFQLLARAVSMFRSIHRVTNAILTILTSLVVCVALLSAFRPKRPMALALLVASLALAIGKGYQFWSWSGNRAAFFYVREAGDVVADLYEIFCYLLPFVWIALYLSLRRQKIVET